MIKLIPVLLMAAFAAATVLPTTAADDAKPAAPAARAIPFRGKIDAIDKQSKTFKINDRTFHTTADTRVVKDGKPGTFADAATGLDVTGSYREGADKKLNVVVLRIGAAPTKPAAPAK